MADILDAAQAQSDTPVDQTNTTVPPLPLNDNPIMVPAITPPADSEPTNTPIPEENTVIPDTTPMPPDPTPPVKKVNKGIIMTIILLLLVTLPLMVFYVSQQRQIAETRSKAKTDLPPEGPYKPGQSTTRGSDCTDGANECSDQKILNVCYNGNWKHSDVPCTGSGKDTSGICNGKPDQCNADKTLNVCSTADGTYYNSGITCDKTLSGNSQSGGGSCGGKTCEWWETCATTCSGGPTCINSAWPVCPGAPAPTGGGSCGGKTCGSLEVCATTCPGSGPTCINPALPICPGAPAPTGGGSCGGKTCEWWETCATTCPGSGPTCINPALPICPGAPIPTGGGSCGGKTCGWWEVCATTCPGSGPTCINPALPVCPGTSPGPTLTPCQICTNNGNSAAECSGVCNITYPTTCAGKPPECSANGTLNECSYDEWINRGIPCTSTTSNNSYACQKCLKDENTPAECSGPCGTTYPTAAPTPAFVRGTPDCRSKCGAAGNGGGECNALCGPLPQVAQVQNGNPCDYSYQCLSGLCEGTKGVCWPVPTIMPDTCTGPKPTCSAGTEVTCVLNYWHCAEIRITPTPAPNITTNVTQNGCNVTNNSDADIKVCSFSGGCEGRMDGYCGPTWGQINNETNGAKCTTVSKGSTANVCGSASVNCGSWQTDVSINGAEKGTAADHGVVTSGCSTNPPGTNPPGTNPPGTNPTTPPGTGTPPPPQCVSIKIYKNGNVVTPSTLSVGDAVKIAVTKNSSSKARVRINGGAWSETTTLNSNNEYTVDWTVPSGLTNFTVESQIYVNGAWL